MTVAPGGEVTMLFVNGDRIGYGRLGVGLAAALKAKGIDVYDHQDAPEGAHQSFGDRQVAEGARSKDTRNIGWVSVPTHARGWLEGQRPFIFTMYEATKLPPSFRENIHEFETVLVPSMQNLELFSEYHPNVHVVPLGVDPVRWRWQPRVPLAESREFRFLCGGSGQRKGTDLAAEAFAKAFPAGSWPKDGPVPTLVLKSPKGVDPNVEYTDLPMDQVRLVNGWLTSDEEVDLYASAHCYVQPSRGEGFGLQPLQAIAQGCPTILTAAHGHDTFAHLGWGLSSTMVPAGDFIYGESGDWWEPSVDEIVDHMRSIFEDYDGAEERAHNASELALNTFTWAKTADRFIDALPDLTEPFTGDPGVWHEPVSKQYRVRVLRPRTVNVAGTIFQFEPGRDYWVPADVKRVMFNAEWLDPECLADEDHGLLPVQVAEVEEYSARNSHCRECGQPLNSRPTRSDEIFEQLEREAAEREAA